MKPWLAAARFLTRLPLGSSPSAERDMVRAPYWFGVVGGLIGAVLAGVEYGLRSHVPLAPRLVIVLVINALLTGALHLDGLADTADGLSTRDRERALAIMRDSRIGTFGVLALLGALALQAAALAQLRPLALTCALVFAPAWGRAALVFSAILGGSARASGLGYSFIAGLRPWAPVAAMFVPAGLAVLLHSRPAAVAGIAAVGLAGIHAAYFRRRLGGQTGDTLGALCVLVETATYWCFLVIP